MIKFSGQRDGVDVLGMGLSRENCNRLLEGKPILFNARSVLGFDLWVTIVAGETEQDIVAGLRETGAIKPTTPLHPETGSAHPDADAEAGG